MTMNLVWGMLSLSSLWKIQVALPSRQAKCGSAAGQETGPEAQLWEVSAYFQVML